MNTLRGTAAMPSWPRVGLLLAIVLACLLPQQVSGQGLKFHNKAIFGASHVQAASMLANWRRNLASATALQQQIKVAAASCKAQGKLRLGTLCAGFLTEAKPSIGVNSDFGEAAYMLAASPSTFDIRSVVGIGLIPYNQEQCNACVALAVAQAASLAAFMRLRDVKDKFGQIGPYKGKVELPRFQLADTSLSPRFLMFCAGEAIGCNNGWYLDDALARLKAASAHPMPLEWCLGWTDSRELAALNSNGLICTKDCNDSMPPGIFSYTDVFPLTEVHQMQAHIREHGSIITRMEVTPYFKGYYAAHGATAVYRGGTQPALTSEQDHAVLIVGYNNDEGYWLLHNTWSDEWADGGFARVAYGQLGLADPAFTYGIMFTPTGSLAAAAALQPPTLLRDKALPSGCDWYITEQGDYLARIAVRLGVQIPRLIDHNLDLLANPAVVLNKGTKLRVCSSFLDSSRFAGLLDANIWVFSVNKVPGNLRRYKHNVTTRHGVWPDPSVAPKNYTDTIVMFKQDKNIVQSADDCAIQCALVPMCGGWSYCGLNSGCGTDCISSRKLSYDCPAVTYGIEPHRERYCVQKAVHPHGYMCTPGVKLPIEFDDWSNEQYPSQGPISEGVCTGNAWPQHTCRLFVDVPKPPVVVKGSAKAGWMSSVVAKPSQCPARITGYECDVCLRSRDPKRCLACSEHVREGCHAQRWYWYVLTLQEAKKQWLWSESCLPCTCPKAKAAVEQCYNATKKVGSDEGDESWRQVLIDAAKQCVGI